MNKAEQHRSLKAVFKILCLSSSEEELWVILKKKLPELVQVDGIELSDTPWGGAQHTYTYLFTYKDQKYFIHFTKAKVFSKESRLFLKKVGQALEWTLLLLQKKKQMEITKEQWEMAFDAMSFPISLTDKDNGILRTNKAFRQLLKKSKEELLGKNSFEVFFQKPLCLQAGKKVQEKAFIHGVEKTFEIVRERLIGFSKRELYLLIFRDISQRIKMEKESALSNKTAEIDIISHSIAHELNNPIAGIQALLQTIKPQEKNKPCLQEMEQAIQRCGQIVQKLLNPPDFGKKSS